METPTCLLGGDFHPHVPASHHDGVGLLEDFVVVADALLVLDFRDNLKDKTTRNNWG